MRPRTIVCVLETAPATLDAALMRAVSMARWYEAELHVVEVRPSHGYDDRACDTGQDALTARITRGMQAAGAGRVAVTPVGLRGNPVHASADYAGRVGADLVIAGTEPRRSDGYWSAGSFAAALGTAASASTMAIASEAPLVAPATTPFRTILAAVDFSEASSRGLSVALALAQEGDARLRVLHVPEYPFDLTYSGAWALAALEEMDTQVAALEARLRSLLPTGDAGGVDVEVATVSATPADAIVEAALEHAADLIVLGLPRRRRLDPIVAGSTAHKVVRRALSPVLLVPGPATVRLPATVGLEALIPEKAAARVLTN